MARKLFAHNLQVQVPAPMHQALQFLVDRDGVSTISSHVRHALNLYLQVRLAPQATRPQQEPAHAE